MHRIASMVEGKLMPWSSALLPMHCYICYIHQVGTTSKDMALLHFLCMVSCHIGGIVLAQEEQSKVLWQH